MRQSQLILAGLVLSWVGVSAGCNRSSQTAEESKQTQSGSKVRVDMNSVKAVQGKGQGITSPAKQQPESAPDLSLDPSTVTSRYLAALHSAMNDAGQLGVANEMLTAKAQTATQLANVDVALPGSANAKYVVHQAEYVTNERNVAHVLTSWKDTVEGENYEYDVTWVLKNEPDSGWKVSGMITAAEDIGGAIVFNFEDASDIVAKGVPETEVGTESTATQTAQKSNGDAEIR